MKRIKWAYKYKIKISAILIVGLFIQPFVFLQQPGVVKIKVSTVSAQSSGAASTTFNTDSTTFSGISQWSNSQFINNPDVAKALKSCNNVVPSFKNKLVGLFSRKKKIQDPTSDTTDYSVPASGASNCGNGINKFQYGNSAGVDPSGAFYTQDEIDTCDSSKIDPELFKENFDNQAIKVTDPDVKKTVDQIKKDTAASKKADEATEELAKQEAFRKECMDSIAYAMSRQALAGITESTVNWIETGNWDDPYYLKEPAQFFHNIRGQTLKQTLGNLYDSSIDKLAQVGSQADYPFLKGTYRSLLNRYGGQSFAEISKSTLADVLMRVNPSSVSNTLIDNRNNPVQAFRTNFNNGGWAGWSALTQNPANNPIGFSIIASNEINKKTQEKETQTQNDLNQGSGFLSQTKCIEEVVPATCNKEAVYDGVDANGDPFFKEYKTGKDVTVGPDDVNCMGVTPAYNSTRGVTAKPNDANCVQTKVVTPGSIIAERMKWSATTDIRQLELADQFNQSLGAVFTAAFTRLQTEGLEYLSKDKYGDWSSQARKQTFLERYNSQFQTIGTTGTDESKQLILRRESTGYSSGDFDITTDLDDQQIGCITNPGIITTQEQYLAELKKSSAKNGPLLRIVPAMAELDYCIPGPTTDWEQNADEHFTALYNTLIDNALPFVRKSDHPEVSSYYAAIGKKMSELILNQERAANFQRGSDIANGVLVAAGAICLAVCATGYGAIVAGAVALVGLVLKLVSAKKTEDAQKAYDTQVQINNEFTEAASSVFADEARIWTDEQITNMVEDYNLFKGEVYTKFSDANSIPVAAEARPFVNSLNSYATNSQDLYSEYKTEIANTEKALNELKAIKKEVDKIKKDATDRVRAQEVKQGLKVGALTDVPLSCKPTAIQCPAKPTWRDTIFKTEEASLADFTNAGLISNLAGNYVAPNPKSDPFPDPAITYIKPMSIGSHNILLYNVSENTLSVKATCSLIGPNNKEVYGVDQVFYSDFSVKESADGRSREIKPGMGFYSGWFEIAGDIFGNVCTLTATGPQRNGVSKSSTQKCTLGTDKANPGYCQEFGPLYTRGLLTPIIHYFTANDSEIKDGEAVTFDWSVDNATDVSLSKKSTGTIINNKDFAVTLKDGTVIHNEASTGDLKGTITFIPITDETYVLTVTNKKNGETTKTLKREFPITVVQ